MCFEDIAMMRTIPNACIVDVTDGTMLTNMLETTKDWDGVTYFRTARRNVPDVYERDTHFSIGKGFVLTEGDDVTVIASGVMVATALDAAQQLAEQGIHVRVVDPVTVKPLDEELVIQCAQETGAIVTAENHSIHGGLGGAVAELLAERHPVPVLRIGVRDQFGQVGPEAFLREQYHLRAEDIVEQVHAALKIKQ